MKIYQINLTQKIACALFLFLLGNFSATRAQSKLELSYGDIAPPLAYSKWIKGTPVQELKGNKLYVLEFWATWCMPCIASMPHLSELAQKYSDKIDVIAINVFERTGNKPYESSLASVESFVEKNETIMKFKVIADNNNKDMANNYLKKANVTGIPATILVKDNHILWIGHPMFLEPVLKEIFEGKYDFDLRKEKYEKEALAYLKSRESYKSGIASIDSAASQGNFNRALQITDNFIAINPENSLAYHMKKLQLLIAHFDAKEVDQFLNDGAKINLSQGIALAEYLGSQTGLSADFHRVAINYLEKSDTKSTFYLDRLAFYLARSGNFERAADIQSKALVLLKEAALKPGSKITTDTIKGFENKIAAYKAGNLGK